MIDKTEVAIEALKARARELFEERDELRRRLLEEANRFTQIVQDISGCVAGARALGGHESDIQANMTLTPQKQIQFNQFQGHVTNLAALYPHLKADFGVEDDTPEGLEVDDSRPEMPRIADVILGHLQAAGEDGAKAADIRRYIYRTYKCDMHEKTVGMTLNRMQAAGQVRREGRTWLLTSVIARPATDTAKPNEGRS